MASPTPDDRRCTGTYKHGDKTGQHCERPARTGHDTCYHHRGPDENRCHAHLTNSHPTNPGGPCPNAPMKGQKVCQAHGGRAKQNRAAAQRRLAEAELEATVSKYVASRSVIPVTNPLQELQELAGRAKGSMETLARIVSDLESIRYESQLGQEQLRAEVGLLERAQNFFRQILVDMAKLNLDERLVQVEEAKAVVVIAAVNAALEHAGISGQRLVEAREVAARHLELAAR